MHTIFQLFSRYARYWWNAKNANGHGMHSPFVYTFIREVLIDRKKFDAYHKVETLRRDLHRDQTVLLVDDFGAGSTDGGLKKERKVAQIAALSAKPKKYGQLLHRMVKYYQPANILELGTSLGVTTAYLSLGNPSATLTTLEGATAVAVKARDNFGKLGISNVNLVEGKFEDTLDSVLRHSPKIDFLFIDGNHRLEPTMRYFNQVLPHLNNDSVIVFDDIYWSREMEQAWAEIKIHPTVRCSIDLFAIGIVFFRREFHEKLDYRIRF